VALMRTRLRLAVVLAAIAVTLQPNALPRRVVELTNAVHGTLTSHLASASDTSEVRLAAISRDDPTDGVLQRSRFFAVAVGIAAIAIASRRRTLCRLQATPAAVPWRSSTSVRGPPFAA
jgi:hypothetical protein